MRQQQSMLVAILSASITAVVVQSQAISSEHDHSETRRRSLRLLGSFDDPKKVEEKPTITGNDNNQKQPRKPFNILALGGSITWGAELEERYEEAYPYVIGDLYNEYMHDTLDVSVDNLAIRATGADYPSMCLQSLLTEATPDDPLKSYDLILLDFILNGLEGFIALMHRLRRRYPDAEIVMVELWNLKGQIEEVDTKMTVRDVGIDPDRDWTWKEHMHVQEGQKSVLIQATEAMVDTFHGRHIALPRPETPGNAIAGQWFSRDWHHLSAVGHRIIAHTIFDVLKNGSTIPLMLGKRVESWGVGDQCYNWFLSGHVPLAYEGAQLRDLTTLDGTTKSFLEINDTGGTIEFVSKFDHPVLLSLGYMSRQEPVMYPRVHVSVESDGTGGDYSTEHIVSTINPNINRLLDQPTAHITTYSPVAYAAPGRNMIHILPMEHTQQPFRVVGIYVCAVCTPYREAMANAAAAEEADKQKQADLAFSK